MSHPAVDDADTGAARAHVLSRGHALEQWPLVLVLLSLAGSLAITATGHWRRGAFAVGCTVLLAGVLRGVLPDRRAGLLAVRGRWFDTALLLVAAGAMLAVTMVVPHTRPGQ